MNNDSFWLEENELREVLEIIKSGNIVQGIEVEKFEKEFARYVGTSHAIAVSTGTAGLHTALEVLNYKKSGNIITTPLSHISTANSILHVGSVPNFVDIESTSMNIDPLEIKNKINSNTNGVVGVHLYGLPFKIREMQKICRENNSFLIEDCAQSLGSKYDGKHTGTFGDAGIFSFYDSKHLKLGEGGMIVTNKKNIMEKCKMIRSHGSSKQNQHEYLGYNFRLNEVFAKIGRIQLKKASKLITARIQRAKIYFEELSDMDQLSLPCIPNNTVHSFYKFPILLKKNNRKRKKIISNVEKKTHTSLTTGYPCPIYKQPLYQEICDRLWLSEYKKFPNYSNLKCQNTESVIRNIIELPTDPWIPLDKIVQISKIFKQTIIDI